MSQGSYPQACRCGWGEGQCVHHDCATPVLMQKVPDYFKKSSVFLVA